MDVGPGTSRGVQGFPGGALEVAVTRRLKGGHDALAYYTEAGHT